MSTSPRMPRERAEAAAHCLMKSWGMHAARCFIVGSLRRGKPDVGDVDLLAPAPEPNKHDALFEAILETCEGQNALFGNPAAAKFTRPIEGLKKGFLACRLVCQLRGVEPGADAVEVPVQVFRYTPENLGWQLIMRTGPDDFGIWFLTQWKARFGIPTGEEHPASVKGHLVDDRRIVVPVPSEADAFEKCGLVWIPPEQRTGYVESRRRAIARDHREMMR